MALTKAQKDTVEAALRDHLRWRGEGEDKRTLKDLRKEFERRHLGGLVKTYQASQAARGVEEIDLGEMV